ncbi:hypothetical protein [Mesorhizobium intechi]|uniref:hypothetical protein n=1 Tax=Mesorhizobium intechi TaxID=537601 RepID=UPI001FEADC42|nr:hypothetical protein [Mesorhizobium intechi]
MTTTFRTASSSSGFCRHEHQGKHFHIEDGRQPFPPVRTPYPPLDFGGLSDAGSTVAVQEIDKYLTWANRPPKSNASWTPCESWPGRPAASVPSAFACMDSVGQARTSALRGGAWS